MFSLFVCLLEINKKNFFTLKIWRSTLSPHSCSCLYPCTRWTRGHRDIGHVIQLVFRDGLPSKDTVSQPNNSPDFKECELGVVKGFRYSATVSFFKIPLCISTGHLSYLIHTRGGYC